MCGAGLLALGAMAAPAPAQQANANKEIPGPIDSVSDIQDTAKMIFNAVDENNDQQISQKEATDAGNLLVGGMFFRADANGDGTLTADEAKAARDSFLSQKPWLRYVFQTIENEEKKGGNQGNSASNLARTMFTTFDTNNDRKLEASEVRQGVQTAVQGVFATADTNRDGQLSQSEVNAAIVSTGRTLAQAAFKRADKDNNNALSEQEFDQALREPVHVAFAVADLNHDGQLSAEEAQQLRQVLISKIQQMNLPSINNARMNNQMRRNAAAATPGARTATPTPTPPPSR
jgi:Ca2+-binding EF-hand superfamily protein